MPADAMPVPAPSRTAGVLVAGALFAHAILAWLAREPGMVTRQDDAVYITLARSLLRGGYHELFRVDSPLHDQYPPVYPALLAIWQLVTGGSFDAIIVLSILLSVAALAVLHAGLRRRFGNLVAVSALLVLAVNPSLIAFAGSVRSETPYMLLSVVALVLLLREPMTWRTVGFVAAAAIAAAMTRSIGVTLVLAIVLYWLSERRWAASAVTAVTAAAVILPWMAFTAMAAEQFTGSSYVAEIRAVEGGTPWIPPIMERVPGMIWRYASSGVPTHLAVPTVPGTPIDNAIAAALLWPCLLAGLWVLWRRWRPAAFYVLTYGGLLAVWVWLADRFVIPLLVVLVPALLLGAQAVFARAGRRAGLAAAGLVAVVLVASGASMSVGRAAERMRCEKTDDLPPPACILRDQASWMEAVRYIRANTPDDAVIFSAKPEPLYYYTGRRGTGFKRALATAEETFLSGLREQGVAYVLLASLQINEPGRILDLLEANCGSLDALAFFPARTWLFRVRAPDEGIGDGSGCTALAQYREANIGRDFERDP